MENVFRLLFKKTLRVYWWRYDYPNKLNFGDELTPTLIKRLFHKSAAWAEPRTAQIAGAGSIIEIVQELSEHNEIIVWGSGFIKPGKKNTHQNIKFVAVRGKLSLSRIADQQVVLGDPGLLTSLAYPELVGIRKKYRIGIIPHYVDKDSSYLANIQLSDSYTIIDVLAPLDSVIESIASCELILSSSLHGLVVSDSFGIPNYWMPFSDLLTGGDYKFNDYYSVFNESAQSLDPATLNTLDAESLIRNYKPKTQLREIQDDLIRSFPFSG